MAYRNAHSLGWRQPHIPEQLDDSLFELLAFRMQGPHAHDGRAWWGERQQQEEKQQRQTLGESDEDGAGTVHEGARDGLGG